MSAAETEPFEVIYADPPWRYDNGTPGREIERHYPTMTHEEICALDVPAARNAVLFLWGVAPKLPEALEVMSSWGFTYRTGAVWDKELVGMGYWFRGQHEHLLVGVKGNWPPPAPAAQSVVGLPTGARAAQQEAGPDPQPDRYMVAPRAAARDVLPLPRARLARLGKPSRLDRRRPPVRAVRPSRRPRAGRALRRGDGMTRTLAALVSAAAWAADKALTALGPLLDAHLTRTNDLLTGDDE